MKHKQNLDWKSALSQSSYGYQKCMFVDFLTRIHGSSQLCSLLSDEYFI